MIPWASPPRFGAGGTKRSRHELSDTPLNTSRGFLVQRGGLPLCPYRYSSRGHLSPGVRIRANTCSRVPHGTAETECSSLHSIRQAVRRVCALTRRFYAGCYTLFLDQRGRVFTAGPLPM